MRLPDLTESQRKVEDSRQFHERLFAASERGARIRVPVAKGDKIQGALHRFWSARGYRLKTHRVENEWLELWVEPRTLATVKKNLEPLRVA